MIRRLVLIICLSLLLSGSAEVYASGYNFVASGADYCGLGGIRAAGGGGGLNADGSPNYYWTWYLTPSLQSGGTLSYSWELRDAQGVVNSGSYDSTSNTSTGGSTSSGASFYASRAETGSLDGMSFAVWGQFYCPHCGYGGSQCTEGIYATTYTTASSGGYFHFQ